VADAAYGSEENYAYLETHRRTAVVKFNTYRLEKTKKWEAQIHRVDNWTYEAVTDEWLCPAEKRLTLRTLVSRSLRQAREVFNSENTRCDGYCRSPQYGYGGDAVWAGVPGLARRASGSLGSLGHDAPWGRDRFHRVSPDGGGDRHCAAVGRRVLMVRSPIGRDLLMLDHFLLAHSPCGDDISQ